MSDGKGHILVVDDDPLNRLQLVQALKQHGYGTAQAEDGEQALQSLGQPQSPWKFLVTYTRRCPQNDSGRRQ